MWTISPAYVGIGVTPSCCFFFISIIFSSSAYLTVGYNHIREITVAKNFFNFFLCCPMGATIFGYNYFSLLVSFSNVSYRILQLKNLVAGKTFTLVHLT